MYVCMYIYIYICGTAASIRKLRAGAGAGAAGARMIALKRIHGHVTCPVRHRVHTELVR